MSSLTLKIICFCVFYSAKKCHLLLRFHHVCVKFTLRTVQVLKDETGVKVNNTEWHERAHCPQNLPLICAVCTCDKMIHQIGSHNDKYHRSSLWLLMEQFCSHPVNMTRSAFHCDRRMRIRERRDLFIPKKLNICWSSYQRVDKHIHTTRNH